MYSGRVPMTTHHSLLQETLFLLFVVQRNLQRSPAWPPVVYYRYTEDQAGSLSKWGTVFAASVMMYTAGGEDRQ